jgi:hypothetical protein
MLIYQNGTTHTLWHYTSRNGCCVLLRFLSESYFSPGCNCVGIMHLNPQDIMPATVSAQ